MGSITRFELFANCLTMRTNSGRDLLAIDMLEEMTRQNISVPDGTAIVGHDDIELPARPTPHTVQRSVGDQ